MFARLGGAVFAWAYVNLLSVVNNSVVEGSAIPTKPVRDDLVAGIDIHEFDDLPIEV